jgi:ATP/maltotriose-dependent transcriptional regulator MalT
MIRGDFPAAEAALAESETALPRPSARLQLRTYERRAQLASRIGDTASAVRIFERLRDLHAALGNISGEQNSMLNLAEIEHARGNTRRAIALVTQMLPDLRAGRERGTFAAALANLAGYHLAVDDLAAAAAAAREGIGVLAADEPTNVLVAIMIEHLGLVYALRGDAARAATLMGYVETAYAHHGFEREFVELATRARLSSSLASALDGQECSRLKTEGQHMSAQTAIAVALARLPP